MQTSAKSYVSQSGESREHPFSSFPFRVKYNLSEEIQLTATSNISHDKSLVQLSNLLTTCLLQSEYNFLQLNIIKFVSQPFTMTLDLRNPDRKIIAGVILTKG